MQMNDVPKGSESYLEFSPGSVLLHSLVRRAENLCKVYPVIPVSCLRLVLGGMRQTCLCPRIFEELLAA